MTKKNSKQRLFEVMERVTPNFTGKALNEDFDWGKIAKEQYGLQNWNTMSDDDKKNVIEQIKQSQEHNDFVKKEFGIQEQQPTPVAGATTTQTQQYGNQPDAQYADSTYKLIAPALKLINTPEKFAPAFQGWFQYLGYSPKLGNISIQRVRMDIENVMKQLGYR